MSDKVYLVSLDVMAEKDLTREQLEVMPIKQLKELATKVLEPKQAINLIDKELLNTENNVLIYREDEREPISFNMDYCYDSEDIIINHELVVHIQTSDDGYNVDLYKNLDNPSKDDNNGYITSTYVEYSELHSEE